MLADDDGNEAGPVETCYSYIAATRLGERLKRQHPTLELVIDARPPYSGW
jgi:hypothetical protein